MLEFATKTASLPVRSPPMRNLREYALIAVLIAISAAPRFPGLGDFTSIDEPFWLRQSANFYYALGQRDFQNTLYEYHPAVTTMWIVTGGMLAYFPEYRSLGQGYLKPGKVDSFLASHGRSMLGLLVASRFIQVVLVLGLLAIVHVILRRLFDGHQAFFATLFLSLAPFLIGQSRLLNHEALVGLFALIALLGMLTYLYTGRGFVWILLSGVAAGLAQLTKSSAVPVIPVVVVAVVVESLTSPGKTLRARSVQAVKILSLWLALAAASYVLFWPGMWVAPLRMLQDVYGNAFSYALQGARVSSLSATAPGVPSVQSTIAGIQVYANDLVWRTTPLTVLGVVLGVGIAIHETRIRTQSIFRWLVLYSLMLAASFVLLFGIQSSPKPPHYILTSYVCMDLIAGLGLIRAWDLMAARFRSLGSPAGTWSVLGLFIAIQLGSALTAYPYYISYYDPVVEALEPGIQNPTLNGTGYGIGLDRAARYLSQKPDARDLVALSANGLGSFSYYFTGTTVPMNDFVMSDPQIAEIVKGCDYVVVDYYNQKRKNLVQDLEGIQPEQTIWINGIDFLRIYKVADLIAPVP